MKRHEFTIASCLLTLAAGLAGCAPQPAPGLRVLQESDVKVGLQGETISPSAATAEQAPPEDVKK